MALLAAVVVGGGSYGGLTVAHQDHRIGVLERQVKSERAQVAQEQTQIYDIGRTVTSLPPEVNAQSDTINSVIRRLTARIDCLESNGIFVRQGC